MMNFMAKPTSFHCNIACRYCFYLEKAAFMENEDVRVSRFMQVAQAEDFMEKRIQLEAGRDVYFTWQGGEPLLAGMKFYEQVAASSQRLEAQYGKVIHHAVQTNGMLIDDAWARLFRRNHFLVGVSMDGDRELHDTYRRTRQGEGTFADVARGIEALQKADVEFNTLTVVNAVNAQEPLRVYRFLKSMGVKFMQFIPVVETVDLDEAHKPCWLDRSDIIPQTADFSVAALAYGKFMVRIFHEWVRKDVTTISIRLFDTLMAQFLGREATLCVFKEACGGDNLALEADGEIYQCDHFVYPSQRFQLGNLRACSFEDLQEKTHAWSAYKRDIGDACKACQWLALCHGGCPKHRFISDGATGRKSYFCEGYQYIFAQLTPGLNLLAEFLEKEIPWEYLPDAIERVYEA